MDPLIRPLLDADRPAVARLLDDAVGAGFWRFTDDAGALSFVAVTDAGIAGVVLTRLEPGDDPDVRTAFGDSAGAAAGADEPVLHVRQLAVAPEARRTGLASRLLARAEARRWPAAPRRRSRSGGCRAGRPEPDAVPFYEAAGYEARPDIADFYAEDSLATGALCPYCGEPPCRCAVRPFVKVADPGLSRAVAAPPAPSGVRAWRPDAVSAPRCRATTCAASAPTRGRRATRTCRSAGRAARAAAPRACS